MVGITKCPSCGGDKIIKKPSDWEGSFKGHEYSIPAVEFYEPRVRREF
jgi:hypothetical protein